MIKRMKRNREEERGGKSVREKGREKIRRAKESGIVSDMIDE